MTPRRYEMGLRRVSTDATRTKILAATRQIIGGKGDLENFSMNAVAKKAGVARMTVYYQFASREALLEALADHLAQRGGMQRMREVFTETDPERALRRLVEIFVGFWATDRPVLRRLRAMGVVSPGQDKGPRDRDSWRKEAIRNLFDKAGPFPGAKAFRSKEDLLAMLTSLTSFETFDGLCHGGRTPEEVSRLLGDVAVILSGLGRPVRP